MKEDVSIKDLVNKAEKSLNASKLLLEKGFYDFAVARAYYTMFYLVEAILLTKGLSFSKHKGVIAAFGEHFAKPETRVTHPFCNYLIINGLQ